MPEMKVNIDMMGANGGQGEVASVLVNGGLNLAALRPYVKKDGRTYINVYKGGNPKSITSYVERPINANATLRRDEWKQLDDALMEVSRQRVTGFNDLTSRGLVYNLGNAMGTTVLEWHDVSEALSAELTMDGITRGVNDQVNFQTNYLPIPIMHVDYEINTRFLESSRKLGNPLDTTLAERAARRILEKQEDMLFTNTTYQWGTKDDRDRNKIYSYLNFPDRNTVNLSIPWDHSGSTAAGILQDVQEMKASNVASYHYGPYVLYIPTAFERRMDDDYDTAGTSVLTIRERIMKLGGIVSIQVKDRLTTDNVLLVQMTSDVVRLINGFGLQNVEWKQEGGLITKYKVMTIQVPQIRSDQNGKCGIVHLCH